MRFRIVCLALSASLVALAQISNAATVAPPPSKLPLSEEDAAMRENVRQSYIGDRTALSPISLEQDAVSGEPLLPLVWSEKKIRVADGTGFGISVAVSGDIAFIGAYSTNSYQGAVYVYQRSNLCSGQGDCVWVQKQRLVASDATASSLFGFSVAFDGTTALVGAMGTTVDGRQSQGAVYVYKRNGSPTFVQAQKLTAPDGIASDCYFGRSVAVAGADALIGAPGCGGTNQVINSAGSAYRYHLDANGAWTIAQKFVGSDGGFGQEFGTSVAISADTAMIGATWAYQFGYYGVGAVYVYRKQCFPDGRCNLNWQEKQKLVGSPTSDDMQFGTSIAFDGTTMLVGAEWALTGDENLPTQLVSGAVYAFAQTNGEWVQTQQLLPSDAYRNWRFGGSVALNGDTAVVGGTGVGWPNMKGAAYVFTRSGGTWTEVQKLTASDATLNDSFGSGVGIANGSEVLVGAPNGLNSSGQGTVYIYRSQ